MDLIDILGIIFTILGPSGVILFYLKRYYIEKDVSLRLLDEFRENRDKLRSQGFISYDGIFDRQNYNIWEQRKTEKMNEFDCDLISAMHKFHTDWTALYKRNQSSTPKYGLTDVNQLKSQLEVIISRLEKYCDTLKWYRNALPYVTLIVIMIVIGLMIFLRSKPY